MFLFIQGHEGRKSFFICFTVICNVSYMKRSQEGGKEGKREEGRKGSWRDTHNYIDIYNCVCLICCVRACMRACVRACVYRGRDR